MRLVAALFVIAIASPCGAQAPDFQTGLGLLRACETWLNHIQRVPPEGDSRDAVFCAAFVRGIAFGVKVTSHDPRSVVCMPEKIGTEQSARVIVTWLKANPQRLHESMELLAGEALYSAFPCPPGPKKPPPREPLQK